MRKKQLKLDLGLNSNNSDNRKLHDKHNNNIKRGK